MQAQQVTSCSSLYNPYTACIHPTPMKVWKLGTVSLALEDTHTSWVTQACVACTNRGSEAAEQGQVHGGKPLDLVIIQNQVSKVQSV